jgi:hypothetical protein
MAILKKTLFPENLERYNIFLEDTDPNSRYFRITELPGTFSGGKNSFLIQGSPELVADTLIKIEIKDALGNVIYHEPGEGIPEYYEGTSKVVAVYVYPDTAFGPCTITILGELSEYEDANGLLTPIPSNWENQYNVRWQKVVNVNPIIANTTKIRFYRRPTVDITETILPIYNRTVNRVTISGSVDGVSVQPTSGSNFRTFKGDTIYELKISGSNFSSSMEGETITITGLNQSYSTIIKDVVNSKKALATIPYYETSSNATNAVQYVTDFSSASFTLPYNESVTLTNSAISSSYAKIKIANLETFSGDVNRLKIFGKRKSDIGNYSLLEDIQLESNELFQTDAYSGSVNVRIGQFSSQKIIDDFWKYKKHEENTYYTATQNDSVLASSVKLQDDNTLNTTQHPQRVFYNHNDIDFLSNTEYQLDFSLLLQSSSFGYGKLNVFGVGPAFVVEDSDLGYGKLLGEFNVSESFRRFDKQQINFKPDTDGQGQIFFNIHQGEWYLSNISLRASQETNFSPNEVTLNVNVPTKVNNDTYDFRFEFYDINNNYVPVTLEKEITFTGGTDTIVQKSLTVTPDNTLFSFSGSGETIGVSSINFDISKIGLTGSVTFYSSAFDANGDYINPSVYASEPFYPGLLTNVTETSATLLVSNFTGSISSSKISRVQYTASCEDVRDLVNIYRVDQGAVGADGIDGQNFIAIANKNQFVYDPDDNNVPAQLNDFIDIKLTNNIVSGSIYITSGSYLPKLALISTEYIGKSTESVYRVFSGDDQHDVAMLGTNVASWSYATPTQLTHKGTYYFNKGGYSSSVQLEGVLKGDKSKNLNAVSNANQFFYKMTDLSLSPSGQTITIDVKRNNLGSTTNEITVTSGSSKPALTVGSNNNTTGVQSYSINGSDYSYSSGATTYTFTAYDLNNAVYSDTITITPVIAESQIAVTVSNENTTFPAYSGGTVFGGFLASSGSISVKVGSEDISYASTIGNNKFSASISSSSNVTAVLTNNNYSITALSADSGSINLKVTYRDGRGSDSTFVKLVTYSKAKAGTPNVLVAVSPSAQSINANSKTSGSATPTALTITALESGTSRFTSIGTPTYTNGLAGTVSSNVITITSTASSITGSTAQVTIPVNYTDSEGTSGTKNVVATVSKALAAPPAVVVSIEKDGQTITKSTAGSYGTPSSFKLYVNEGGSAYAYDATSPYVIPSFRISSVTNGTNAGVDGDGYTTITPSTPSSTSGLIVSITGSYVDSEGTSTTFYKTHNVNVSSDGTDGNTGATGPGIVLRGEYAAGTTYYYTTVAGSSRRDAVYQSSGGVTKYYATLQQTTGNAPTDGASNSYWEYLGTQDFFVAAKIAIFDESYVKNTLNIGTNASGSAANITLAGGTTKPFVSIGQGVQSYGTNGIWLGISGSSFVPKVSFVSGSNYFKYDASATNIVDIGGAISATTLTAQTGSIGGFEIQAGKLIGGTATNGVILDGGQSRVIAGNSSGNSQAVMSIAGFHAGNTAFNSAPFRVDTAGALVASNANISGKITATDGTIGGWVIGQNSISKDKITLNAGGTGADNYIQITGESTYAGNRVLIHPGELLTTVPGAGSAITATTAQTYFSIGTSTPQNLYLYNVNGSTVATLSATSTNMYTSLSATSTYSINASVKYRIDLEWNNAPTMEYTYVASTGTFSTVDQAALNIAYHIKYNLSQDPTNLNYYSSITRGWIGGSAEAAVTAFISYFNTKKGTSYTTLSQMDGQYIDFYTSFDSVTGTATVTSTLSYGGTSIGSISRTVSPSTTSTQEEFADTSFQFITLGKTTNPLQISTTKSNGLVANYRKTRWHIDYYDSFTLFGFGTIPAGYAIWAESIGVDSYSPSSTNYYAKGLSLTATSLTKQVEISERGLQALFNSSQDSTGNFLKVEDIATPTAANANIKSAGYFAHYGELHVKGDIAGFSTSLSSDIRLKKNIVDIDETEIEDMDRLHPVAYSWNSDSENKKHYGFIAQDVEKIYPNLTDGRIMGEYLTIKYNELIPIMVKQIQNLKKEVNTLKQVLSNGK